MNPHPLEYQPFMQSLSLSLSLSLTHQRDGIYREGILEHFLPKSKQAPKPSANIEC